MKDWICTQRIRVWALMGIPVLLAETYSLAWRLKSRWSVDGETMEEFEARAMLTPLHQEVQRVMIDGWDRLLFETLYPRAELALRRMEVIAKQFHPSVDMNRARRLMMDKFLHKPLARMRE